MINPRKIEQLDEATNLQDNDLVFASVLNAGNTYVSKKVTLANIANYVRNGMEPIEPGFDGYEMIDTTEDGDGIYTSETISQYISDSSKNYLWGLSLGVNGVYSVDEPFEKELGKDCAIWIDGFNTEGTEQGETQVFLNGVRLYNLTCLRQGGRVFLYAKAGQTVKIQQTGLFSTVYIIPLASGGKYFFDTSDPTRFKRGVLIGTGATEQNNWYTDDNDFIVQTSNHIKVTAPYPLLFAGGFILNKVTNGNISTVNGKQILYAGDVGYDRGSSLGWYICLRENDVFETDIASNVGTYWLSYPLLMDSSSSESEPESVQLWENGPYWATRNIGAKRDIDFGEYFQYGSLNGYRYENNVFVGNGNDNFEFTPNSSLVYGKSKEELLQDGIITQDNVLTPNYDAATQKFGSEWKIPSYNDWIALNSYCDMYWTRKNGVEGVMITGRNAYANKSIFLPNSGHAQSDRPIDQIRYSSTKISYGSTTTYAAIRECAYFSNSGQSDKVLVQEICAVQDGLPIRPVKG